MVDEIGEFLFHDKDETCRENGLEDLFEKVDSERRRFAETHLNPDSLTEFSLEVIQRGSVSLQAKYSSMPSPVLLLEMCLKLAEPGDEVIVSHRYASEEGCEFRSVWPFGMDWAVTATNPMAERLRDDCENVGNGEMSEAKFGGRQKVLKALVVGGTVASMTLGAALRKRLRR